MTTFNINQDHNSDYRPKYQLGISKPPTKIPEYSSLDILRSENYNKYYESISPEFVFSHSYDSIIDSVIYECGSGYNISSIINFPLPDNLLGTRASGIPVFGLTNDSLSLQIPGTGYKVGDVINIISTGLADTHLDSYRDASIEVLDIDASGGVEDWRVLLPGYFVSGTSPLILSIDDSVVFDFNTNNYRIIGIEITNSGEGYAFLDASGNKKSHPISLEGSGSGFIGYAITRRPFPDDYILAFPRNLNIDDIEFINDREQSTTHTKYGFEVGNMSKLVPSIFPTGMKKSI